MMGDFEGNILGKVVILRWNIHSVPKKWEAIWGAILGPQREKRLKIFALPHQLEGLILMLRPRIYMTIYAPSQKIWEAICGAISLPWREKRPKIFALSR